MSNILNKRGRRLKRIFGLRHERAGAVHSGGIEHLMPGRISGWVVAQGIPLHDVRLLLGAHLVARAEIDQDRPDVCEALGWQGKPGFSMALPTQLPPISPLELPRLLAVSVDGSQQVELALMQQPKQTRKLLETLLRSDLLGLEGHCDGIQQGAIRGWAGRRGQAEPTQIWLQASGQEALAIPCNQWREGMQGMGLPPRSGFSIDPYELPPGWGGRQVWLSFDRPGEFRLPQVESITLPSRAGRPGLEMAPAKPALTSLRTVYAQTEPSQLEGLPEDLRSHWQALESFKRYLDGLEQELDRRDQISRQPPKQKAKWWSRLLGPVG